MSAKYARMAGVADEKELAEDFSQEAKLALYRASQSYNRKSDEVSFGLYAKICIRNALVSELRRMNRKKKTDIAQKFDLKSTDRDRGRSLTNVPDIGAILESGILSALEKKIFVMYTDGMKIRDIAKAVGKSSKSVSNAVFRIKSKVRIYVTDKN